MRSRRRVECAHARIPSLCRGSVVIKIGGSLLTPVDEDFNVRCLRLLNVVLQIAASTVEVISVGKPQRCILQQRERHQHVLVHIWKAEYKTWRSQPNTGSSRLLLLSISAFAYELCSPCWILLPEIVVISDDIWQNVTLCMVTHHLL